MCVNFSEIKADVNGFFHFFSLFFRLCYKKDAFISSDSCIFHHFGAFVKGFLQEFGDILREGAVSMDIRDTIDASDVDAITYGEMSGLACSPRDPYAAISCWSKAARGSCFCPTASSKARRAVGSARPKSPWEA